MSEFSGQVFAQSDLDRQFDLSTVGALRAWDNMDGLFGEYVAAAYQAYFSKENRFIYNDLAKANSIFNHSTLAYAKIIEDRVVLAQLARSTRTESLLRTKVVKSASGYAFTIDWLHAPHMEVMATIDFSLDSEQPLGEELLSQAFEIYLTRLFLSLPFSVSVTGRDGEVVTVNLGSHVQANVGDILVLSTLDSIQVHPLTHAVVDWQLTRTGELQIEQIEDGMAFCKVLREMPGRVIARSQKVSQVKVGDLHDRPGTAKDGSKEVVESAPTLGWVGGGLFVGSQGWQTTTSGATLSGGGLAFKGRAGGQIWLNRKWFFEGTWTYSFWGLSQQDVATGTSTPASQGGGVSGSFFSTKLELGHTFLMGKDMLGPKGWVKAGYRTASYSMPASITEGTGPIALGSFLAGLGGEFPMTDQWGFVANLSFRLFSMATAPWVADNVSGASDVEWFLGAYQHLSPRLTMRAGLDLFFTGIDFLGGTSVNQKTITIGPTLLYYL